MNQEKVREEIDFLWAFWLKHSCEKCTDDPNRRLPTERFPAIFEMMCEWRNTGD